MRNLPELLELAARVAREHPDAPELANVSLGHNEVMLQIASVHDSLRAIALWAEALRSTVEITPRSTHYKVTATRLVEVDGVGEVRVVAWTHLELAEILLLARQVGVVVDHGPMEVTSRRLLAALDAVPAEGRVA